ncbi:MAG: NAD(P)H-dependent glycerol-3-phosphate dehydrogenase [Vicinamibacteria bacterium]
MKRIALTLGALALVAGLAAPAAAQGPGQRREPDPRSMGGGDCRDNPLNCRDTPNPLPPADTVWIEAMTWMDVRDALAKGKTTVIIPTGGVEPNGPWLVTGKHNYVLRANCDATARLLGNALFAPVVPFVPEGGIEPPTGHMTSPGTISMRQETFEALLTDIAHSLKMHGFKTIIFIGDSGGNQAGQRAVAEELNKKFNGEAVVAHVQEEFRSPALRLYGSHDVVGVEIGGALKNVIAIAAGVVEGLGLGHNALSALITRGLAEISRLAVGLGGERDTLAGLAGLGDLVLTCTGQLSRNRHVGTELARGRPLREILASTKMVAEGVRTTNAALELAARAGLELPIATQMADVLAGRKDPRVALFDLMGRRQRAEIEPQSR